MTVVFYFSDATAPQTSSAAWLPHAGILVS